MRYLVISFTLLIVPAIAFGAPLVTVNGQSINPAQLAYNAPTAKSPQEKKQALQILIDRTLLAQEAIEKGWDKNSMVKAALDSEKIQTLASVTAQHYWAEHPISPNALQKAYQQEHFDKTRQLYRMQEIIVASRPEADKLIEKLQKGASFSNLASQYSVASNADIGGQTGWQEKAKIPAPYVKYMEELKNDEIAGPIVVPAGWAIIRKLQEQLIPTPSLATIRPKLLSELRNKAISNYVQQLRAKAKIVFKPEATNGQQS